MTDDESDFDLKAYLALRPTLVDRQSHPNHWFNRSSDLRASAGALWRAMHSEPDGLGLPTGFSMGIACQPVYYMLCGLALELAMKARLAQLGQGGFKTHDLVGLNDLLKVSASETDRQLLSFYTEAMIWAGRYPLPIKPTDEKLLAFWKLADDVLTEPVAEISGLQLRRGNDAGSWERFHTLWRKYADLFEHS